MNRNTLILVVLFIIDITCIGVITSNNLKCNDVESKSPTLQLKRHLLCEYDPDVRPVQHNSNVTRVRMRVVPWFLEYVHEEETFTLQSVTKMSWDDVHLTWDPAKFDDLSILILPIYEIWVPDILLHNIEIEESVLTSFGQTVCWISKTGLVNCEMLTKYSIHCTGDNTWWPYNIMNCTLQFGSWSHSVDEINLILDGNLTHQADLENFQQGVEWDLLQVNVTRQQEKHKYDPESTVEMISYHFILRRNWGIIRIAYVTPAIRSYSRILIKMFAVLMIMTLTALWLEPCSLERMMIANLNFICHLLCIGDVHWEMPKSGFNTPKLLTFYERSFAMALFALIFTNILRQLEEWSTDPPVWISAATTSVLRSRVGRILLVSVLDPVTTAKIEADADDNTDLVRSDSKQSPWRYVTLLVGWLALAGVFLAYVALLATCLPMYHAVDL